MQEKLEKKSMYETVILLFQIFTLASGAQTRLASGLKNRVVYEVSRIRQVWKSAFHI